MWTLFLAAGPVLPKTGVEIMTLFFGMANVRVDLTNKTGFWADRWVRGVQGRGHPASSQEAGWAPGE